MQDWSPGDVLVSVPLGCTIHYSDADLAQRHTANDPATFSSSSSSARHAALKRLQQNVPVASDGRHGAWQFKMALEVRQLP